MGWSFTIDGSANTSLNVQPATGAIAVWDIIRALKQAGWVVKADSDGTTYNASGGQVTSGASGAGGLGNNSAWVRIQSPDAVCEWTFQRGTTDLVWRAKFSPNTSPFTGGSPGATQTPSATNEGVVYGGGSDANPTFSTVFGTNNTYKICIGTENTAPYDWWFSCAATPTPSASNARGGQFSLLSGSYPTADVAPYVVEFGNVTAPHTTWRDSISSGNRFGAKWLKLGLSGATFGAAPGVQLMDDTGAHLFPRDGSANPYDSNGNGLPIPLARRSALSVPGWIGFLRTTTVAYKAHAESFGAVVDFSGSTYICFDYCYLRWPTGVAYSG